MTLYFIGNLIGRLALSYAIVWLLMWITARREWRTAFRRTARWYGVLAIAVLFGLGMLTGAAKSARVAQLSTLSSSMTMWTLQ